MDAGDGGVDYCAIRQATIDKFSQIDMRIKKLTTLQHELQLLINLCQQSEDGCPIIDDINDYQAPSTGWRFQPAPTVAII